MQLQCRVRHLTQGVIVGSKEFIDQWFAGNQSRIYRGSDPETRKTGARTIRRATLPDTQTLRNLR